MPYALSGCLCLSKTLIGPFFSFRFQDREMSKVSVPNSLFGPKSDFGPKSRFCSYSVPNPRSRTVRFVLGPLNFAERRLRGKKRRESEDFRFQRFRTVSMGFVQCLSFSTVLGPLKVAEER